VCVANDVDVVVVVAVAVAVANCEGWLCEM